VYILSNSEALNSDMSFDFSSFDFKGFELPLGG